MEYSTEYDLETFMDEYQPLFGRNTVPPASSMQQATLNATTRLEQIKKRYFADSHFVNKKLSKMKKTVIFKKKNKSKESKTRRRDSSFEETNVGNIDTNSNVTVIESSEIIVDGGKKKTFIRSEIVTEVMVDDLTDENDDEEVGFFTSEKQNSESKYFSLNRATAFVRNRAKILRRRPLLRDQCFAPPKTTDTEVSTEETTSVNNNNTDKIPSESDSIKDPKNRFSKFNKLKGSRYLWQNARKRMNYVVSFIRKREEEDEVFLMEEDENEAFPSARISRSYSCSDILESSKNMGHLSSSNTALHTKYLSPATACKLNSQYSLHESSCKSSRRNSLGSNTGQTKKFLSQRYLNKSQSQHSITTNDGKQQDFEQCFFHAEDFEQDGSLQCVQNNLYGSNDELGNDEFLIGEHEYKDIIDEEVNNYMKDFGEKSNDIGKIADDSDSLSDNIKHTSTFSYSVNDLYEIFNKDKKFNSLECKFEDLVV